MNDSKSIFPSKYKLIEKQDHKEPDFVDIENGNKFDAKLLFENQICIALNNNDLPSFINKLTDMVGMDIPTQRNIGPKQTMLYQEMEKRINSLEDDESGVLFLPYPILMSFPGSFTDFCSDSFDWCFSEMKTKKNVYLIGMNIEGSIVCEKLGACCKKEYLENIYFEDVIKTEIINFKSINE